MACFGVLNLEGKTIPITTALLEKKLAISYSLIHHYQDVPALVFVILLVVGFMGNVVNVFVYSRPFMQSSINYILCALEFVNIFLFVTFIPNLLRYYKPELTITLAFVVFSIILEVVEVAVVCCSNWLTVAVGVWRYVAITWPLNVNNWCNKKKTKWTIAGIMVASAATTSPVAFLKSTQYLQFNVTYHSGTADEYSELRRIYVSRVSQMACDNPSLNNVAIGLILITTSIPCFCLAIVTILLLHGLWKAKRVRDSMMNSGSSAVNQRKGINPANKKIESDHLRERRITITLIILVILFLLAYMPNAVLIVIYFVSKEEISYIKDTTFFKMFQTKIFVLASNGLTFFIYYCMSERYRQALFRSFRQNKTKKDLSKVSSSVNSQTYI